MENETIALYARTSSALAKPIWVQLHRAYAELRWQELWHADGGGDYSRLFLTAPDRIPSDSPRLHLSDQRLVLKSWPLPEDSGLATLLKLTERGEIHAVMVDRISRIFGHDREVGLSIKTIFAENGVRLFDPKGEVEILRSLKTGGSTLDRENRNMSRSQDPDPNLH
jgi:hypothetical protein